MAYKTEIQIGVKGTTQLDKLRQQVTSLNKKVNEIDASFGRGVQSVKRYEETLQKAADTLRKAKMATDDEERAVKQYVTALNNANAAQQRQNSLIQQEITRRGQATQALRAYNAELAKPRQPGGSMAGSYLRPQQARGTTQFPGPIGPGPASQIPFGPIGGPSSSILGGQSMPVDERISRALQQKRDEARLQEALLSLEERSAQAENKKLQIRKELARITAEEVNRVKALPTVTPGTQYDFPIGPSRGRPPSPKPKPRPTGLQRFAEFGLGAGFPLLFGGGAGQVLGGALGTAIGGGGPAGFGLQIAFSAIGGQIEDAIARTAELGRALESLDLSALADSTLLVNAELREAVQNSIDLGESQKAVEAIAKETLLQTGLFPENIQDATNAATLLSNVWDELVGSVSGLLSVLATPFLSALTAILSLVNAVVKGVNTVVGFIGKGLKLIVELIGKLPIVNKILAFLKENTEGVNEAEEERIFKLKQSTKELEKELALDNELLAIEQRRTAGTDAAAKLNGAQVKRDLALRKLYAKTEKDIVKVRQEFGNVNSQILKDELFAKEIAVLRLATNEKTRILNQYALDEKAAGLQREKEIEKELKELEKERLEIRARESKVGQTRIQTQLNELANEEKIFQIRQQTATATIALDRARLDSERSLLQLQESRLQRELDGLQKKEIKFERQRELVNAIARNRVQQAEIENKVAKAQAKQGIRQAEIAQMQVKFQVQRIQLELQLQRIKAQGEKDDKIRLEQLRAIDALQRQNAQLTAVMVTEASKQVRIANQIAKEQEKVADNILKGKLESIEAERVEARRAINAKELAKATSQAADEAARLNSNMSSGGASSQTVSTSLPIDPDVQKAVAERAGPFGYRNIYEMVEKLEEAQKLKNAREAKTAQMSQPSSSSFASSSSYAPRSASRGGGGTATVNVSTGPVMQVENKRYVSMEDFESGLRQVARSTAQTSRSYGSRRYGGIG